MWQFFASIEPIFAVLILSYFVVLIVALILIKKDMRKTISSVFKLHGYSMVLVGLVLALLFQALWFLISVSMGSRLEFTSFPSLRGYENYVFYSLPIAFALYLIFSIFGSFVEEVAYRGYVQSRISAKHGYIGGILVSATLFSLQHIHIFQPVWIGLFFQNQFIYVLLFGVFVGYLFVKSSGNIWSVFVFHASMNVFNISLPIKLMNQSTFVNTTATITSFVVLVLILRFLTRHRIVVQ
jgi:membrane protease YdiL (CAAX protease family)